MKYTVIKKTLEARNIRPEMFAVMINRSISTVYNLLAGRKVNAKTMKAVVGALNQTHAYKKGKTGKKAPVASKHVPRTRSRSMHQRVSA